jgi:hypothetical protein
MKRFLLFSAILLMVISCSKEIFDKKEVLSSLSSTESKSSVIKMPNLDSIAKMNAGAFIKRNLTLQEMDSLEKIDSKELPNLISTSKGGTYEYTDESGLIHLKVIYGTTSFLQHPFGWISVPDDYVLVGGGAWTWGWSHDGGFLTESRPDSTLDTWFASSKDHINYDPHYLTIYAICMRIEGVDPNDLKSKVHYYSNTSFPANHPSTQCFVPSNCLLIGGGARDNYNNYGNMLVKSYPSNGNYWIVEGKDHRRPDPCTITAYAIGIENISFPNVGYLQVDWNISENNWVYGISETQVSPPQGGALTCPGGSTSYTYYGRMLTGIYPEYVNFAISKSKDHTYPERGDNYAFCLSIKKAN